MGYSPWGRKESDTTERLSTARVKSKVPGTPMLVLLWWEDSLPRYQGHTDLLCACWYSFLFFFFNLEGMYPWFVWCSFDLKRYKTVFFQRSLSKLSENFLRVICVLVGSNITLFYSYHSLAIDYLHWQFFLIRQIVLLFLN